MLRTSALIVAMIGTGSSAAVPDIGGSFAVKCNGITELRIVESGAETREENKTGEQVFVVDPTQNIVFRALDPRQEYDPVCGTEDGQGKAHISPGMITASSYERRGDMRIACNLAIDRKAGTASHSLRFDYADGNLVSTKWDMTCVTTPVPVFDIRGNKF